MIDNNLLVSLLLAVINTIAFYFLKNNDEINMDKRNHELLMLFGITFASSFLLKSCSGLIKGINEGGGMNNIMSHSSRAPF